MLFLCEERNQNCTHCPHVAAGLQCLLDNRMTAGNAQYLEFLGDPVGIDMARQWSDLNLEKGTRIGCCLDDSDAANILRQEVALQPFRIVTARKCADLQV
jgi:hypothetical protein